MHTFLEQEHTTTLWFIGRGTLGPKKMRVTGFWVISKSKHLPVALLAALRTLLAIAILLTLPIILLTLHLPLAPRLITELAGARILKHR